MWSYTAPECHACSRSCAPVPLALPCGSPAALAQPGPPPSSRRHSRWPDRCAAGLDFTPMQDGRMTATRNVRVVFHARARSAEECASLEPVVPAHPWHPTPLLLGHDAVSSSYHSLSSRRNGEEYNNGVARRRTQHRMALMMSW